MPGTLRYLLLQVRNADDPMRNHEVRCFARALRCAPRQVGVFDLLAGVPTPAELDAVDVVVLGGSGDYSVAKGGDFLETALEAMRELSEMSKPTFASCWGFQAMARALGGDVVTDLSRSEVGTFGVSLTEAGRLDPVFAPMGESFPAQMGHNDIVDTLPDDAVLLASSDRTKHQAFRLAGKPIYCTQFHPELSRAGLLDRLRRYPQYIASNGGGTYEEFAARCRESYETNMLLLRFVQMVKYHLSSLRS